MIDLRRSEWSWSKFIDLRLHEFQALIIDYENKKLLLKRSETLWMMPAYVGDQSNYGSSFLPEFVKNKIQEEVKSNLDLCVLRQVWREERHIVNEKEGFTLEKAVVLVRCFVRETRQGEGERDFVQKGVEKSYVWVPLSHAEVYHLFPDAQKVIVEEITMILQDRLPENRLSWQHPEWMKRTTLWMKDVLARKRKAYMLKQAFVERSTPYGTIIIAETTKGKFFLKCTPPWRNDAAYTEVLSRIAPKHVAAPVAVDVEKQVMLTSDYGEILVPLTFNEEDEIKLTMDFVKLQQEASKRIDELICVGMPDFREDALMKHMDWVVSHPVLEAVSERKEYKQAVEYMRENLDKMKAKVRTLYGTDVPPTVTHNDTLLSNVYMTEGREKFMFFDWVEGYVAHPLTGDMNGFNTNEYIREWEEYANSKELSKWLDLGQTVRTLIECISGIVDAEKVEKTEREDAFKRAGHGFKVVQESFSDMI